MRTTLHTLLESGQPVIADGAMGTMLFARGLERGECPELWNVDRPADVRAIHEAYIAAGAQIVLTNTFGGSRARLDAHGVGDRTAELNTAAAQVARAAADAVDQPVVVAGSMGPTGQMLAPMGTLSFEDAASMFEEQARALIAGGVDVLWIETMSDLEEVRAAAAGARRADKAFPLVTTMSFDTHGRTMMGVKPGAALEALRDLGVVAVGSNCGKGPDELEASIVAMQAVDPAVVLVAKANAGVPRMVDGETVYDAAPDVMAAYAVRARDKGARIIGACCGSTPDHIRAIAQALAAG
ncbi:MAG: betaine--homocysteine S-methyltransferase [Anaerolineae bacterium]|nr:betaine--homocysteine S-methyltransferase [Anaerolineae bacterium]